MRNYERVLAGIRFAAAKAAHDPSATEHHGRYRRDDYRRAWQSAFHYERKRIAEGEQTRYDPATGSLRW